MHLNRKAALWKTLASLTLAAQSHSPWTPLAQNDPQIQSKLILCSGRKEAAVPPVTCRDITLLYSYPALCGESSDCYLSLHIFWACFPVIRLPLALRDIVGADASLSFICSPAALLQCAATGQRTEAPGTVHSELDGLSLSREEIETDYHITVFTISISLPPGNPTKSLTYTDHYQENTVVRSLEKSFNKRAYSRNPACLDIIHKDQPLICSDKYISHW